MVPNINSISAATEKLYPEMRVDRKLKQLLLRGKRISHQGLVRGQ